MVGSETWHEHVPAHTWTHAYIHKKSGGGNPDGPKKHWLLIQAPCDLKAQCKPGVSAFILYLSLLIWLIS